MKGLKMKFKNVDILISRRLPSLIPTNEIIFEDRLNSIEGTELPVNELPMLIKEFFIQNKVHDYDKFPDQIITSINSFIQKPDNDIVQGDIQNLFSIFDYFNFPFKYIQRIDLDEPTKLPDTAQRSYLINNFMYNTSMVSGIYTGYAMNYDDKGIPVATDFMYKFNFSPEIIDKFNLDSSMKSYEYFKRTNNLRNLNDTYVIQFFRSRGYSYMIERSVL